jgi:hypothetical protein
VDAGFHRTTASCSAIVQFLHRGACPVERSAERFTPENVFRVCFRRCYRRSDDCALCHRVREEEVTRLRKLAQQFPRPTLVEWMKTQGVFAWATRGEQKEFVALRYRALVAEVVERNRAELREELEVFHRQRKQGRARRGRIARPRGGIPGRSEGALISGGQHAQSGTWQKSRHLRG